MLYRTRIKICGLTTVEAALEAAEAGADAIGLVFHPASCRYVAPSMAAAIAQALPPFVSCVGLVVDLSPQHVQHLCAEVALDVVQFHGNESPEVCAQSPRPWLRAVPMGALEGDLDAWLARYSAARGFLFDSHGAGHSGGSGQAFDWQRIPTTLSRPWLLAGGLHPDNVAAAVQRLRPWGVDVSSGVESSPGKKDLVRMRAFVEAVRRADAQWINPVLQGGEDVHGDELNS